jgi:hypothetical protein
MQTDMTSKVGVRAEEVPEGTEEIDLIKDPAPQRHYDLIIDSSSGRVLIPLQTPEAQGWMLKYAEQIKTATSATLMPLFTALPEVTVILGSDRELVYFRRVRGRISGRYQTETVTHNLGWRKGTVTSVVTINPDGSLTLE